MSGDLPTREGTAAGAVLTAYLAGFLLAPQQPEALSCMADQHHP